MPESSAELQRVELQDLTDEGIFVHSDPQAPNTRASAQEAWRAAFENNPTMCFMVDRTRPRGTIDTSVLGLPPGCCMPSRGWPASWCAVRRSNSG